MDNYEDRNRDPHGAYAPGRADSDDPAAIRAEIERTRQRMSHTVDELGYRLNPDRLKSRVKQNIHDATVGKAENMARIAVDRADETRHSIMDTLRDNPVPAAMVGIGLGWLLVNGRRDHEVGYHGEYRQDYDDYRTGRRVELGYTTLERERTMWNDDIVAQRYRAGITTDEPSTLDRASGRFDAATDHAEEWADEVKSRTRHGVEEAREKANEARETAKDRAYELKANAQDRVTEIAHDARDFADRTQDRLEHTAYRARERSAELARRTRRNADRIEDRIDTALHESPLAVGAAAVALGLAFGLSVPATRRESELMGPKRDELFDRARDRAGEMGDRARHVAERFKDEAKATAREAKSTAQEIVREEGMTGSGSNEQQGSFSSSSRDSMGGGRTGSAGQTGAFGTSTGPAAGTARSDSPGTSSTDSIGSTGRMP